MMSSYIPIASQTTSGIVTSVTFNSIPITLNGKTLRDIVIITSVRAQAFDSWLGLRFNADSGNNYHWVQAGNGNATNSTGASVAQIQLFAHLTTSRGAYEMSILDFAQTNKHKTVIGTGGSSGSFGVAMTSGRWASTNAINSITLFGGQGLEFAAGSTFSIFGIEG